MQIDLNNLVSISEANQNFSKVAHLVDEKGAAVIMKNNFPKYVLIEFSKLQEDSFADKNDVEIVAMKFLNKYKKAFEELAK